MRKIITLLVIVLTLLGCSPNKLTVNDLGNNFKETNGVLEYTANTIDDMVEDVTYLTELLDKQKSKENQQYISSALELVEEQLEQKSEELNENHNEAVENLNKINEKLNKAAN